LNHLSRVHERYKQKTNARAIAYSEHEFTFVTFAKIGIILILQQSRLQWYGHVLQKEDPDWMKKCREYEVEGSRPRGRPKRTWREVV